MEARQIGRSNALLHQKPCLDKKDIGVETPQLYSLLEEYGKPFKPSWQIQWGLSISEVTAKFN